MDHPKEVIKLLREASYRHDLFEVFRDCMEMIAIALSNRVDTLQYEQREARYMGLVKRYSADELTCFARVYAHLVNAFEQEYRDHLGSIFMELGLGNADRGQFFTPYDVCRLMAQVSTIDASKLIEEKGRIRFHEPAVGAGGMVIAACQTMLDQGINFQESVHYTCVDIDPKAVHMAYIQLSIIGVPAVVVLGNTLTLEQRECWYTPFHFLRWRRHHSKPLQTTTRRPEQMELF